MSVSWIQQAFSVTEASRVLGMSEPQVRRLIKNGIIEAKKIGQHWRINRQELTRLLKCQGRGE